MDYSDSDYTLHYYQGSPAKSISVLSQRKLPTKFELFAY